MSKAVAKPLSLRCFLEGEEIPVISAQVSINTNGAAVSSIQVIPLDEATQLKPRTMVHLFFLEVAPVIKVDGNTGKSVSQLADYKLLFSGEVVGFQYAIQPNARSVVLQCLDFSSYYDACHATAIEYGPQGNAFTNQSALYGSNASLFDDIANQQAERLVGWLRSKPQTPGLKNVSGLAGGIIRMLEAMSGVPGHSRGVNDFFTIAELRCRLLAQITAEENDDTASRLLSNKVFDEWLRNGLQNIGQQVSFRDMMLLLFRYIYYDIVPNPAAKLDPGDKGTTGKGKGREVRIGQSPLANAAVTRMREVQTGLNAATGYSSTAVDAVKATAKAKADVLKTVVKDLDSLVAGRKEFSGSASKAKTEITKVIEKLSSLASKDSSFNDLIADIGAANQSVTKAIDIIQNGTDVVVEPGKPFSTGRGARLRSQIIRPDCWFVPPPRCNVIFPEHYASLNYDRTYLGEVTRVLVMAYNTLVGKDGLLSDKVLAPNIATDLRSVTAQVGKKGGNASAYRALMDHELHTGIVPRSEWLPNTGTVNRGKNDPEQQKRIRGARNTWASRIALFHFFKYRFSTRSVAVAGRFNPYVVCGFPAVVIRTPFIPQGMTAQRTDEKFLDEIQDRAKELGAPSQILGMVAGVSHTISQDGGTSSITLHHARQHLGVDDEFVGLFSQIKEKRKSVIRVVLTEDNTRSNPTLRKLLVGVTPQTDKPGTKKVAKTSQKNATVSYVKTQYVDGQKVTQSVTGSMMSTGETVETSTEIPFVTKGRLESVNRDEALIPNPPGSIVTGKKGVFGTIRDIEVLAEAETVQAAEGRIFKAVALYEEIQLDVATELPIEDIIRPGWFAKSYSNGSIGKKIYEPFFGVGSIIDELVVAGAGTVDDTDDVVDFQPSESLSTVKKTLGEVAQRRSKASIERAVNLIGYLYGVVKHEGLDVDEFVRAYSSRPIASLDEMLGTDAGKGVDLQVAGDGTVSNVTGTLGFHTMAVHPKTVEAKNLAGLVEDPDLQIQRINNQGKKGPVPPSYDVRWQKRERVMSYIKALKKGPAFRG